MNGPAAWYGRVPECYQYRYTQSLCDVYFYENMQCLHSYGTTACIDQSWQVLADAGCLLTWNFDFCNSVFPTSKLQSNLGGAMRESCIGILQPDVAVPLRESTLPENRSSGV